MPNHDNGVNEHFHPIFNAALAERCVFGQAPRELSHRVPSFAYLFIDEKVESILDIEKLQLAGIPQGPIWGRLKSGEDVEYQETILKSEIFVNPEIKKKKVIVCGDNDNPELLREVCLDCNVLIHESTYTEDIGKVKGKSFGHSYAKLVAEFAESVRVPNLLLTHFSARYQDNTDESPSIADIFLEAEKIYSGNLYIAKDLDRYSLDKSGKLKLLTA